MNQHFSLHCRIIWPHFYWPWMNQHFSVSIDLEWIDIFQILLFRSMTLIDNQHFLNFIVFIYNCMRLSYELSHKKIIIKSQRQQKTNVSACLYVLNGRWSCVEGEVKEKIYGSNGSSSISRCMMFRIAKIKTDSLAMKKKTIHFGSSDRNNWLWMNRHFSDSIVVKVMEGLIVDFTIALYYLSYDAGC